MQHLVVHDVIDGVARDPGMVEKRLTTMALWPDVVSQMVSGMVAAPGHLRACQETVEPPVEVLEDRFQIVGPALSGMEPFASTHLAQ